MKKILYANGDSFVLGMECIADHDRTESNKDLAFPKHISKALRCNTYINNAYNGATNSFIFNQTIFDLQELERQGHSPKDVFVVIGFTSLTRIEIDGLSWLSKMPTFNEDWFIESTDSYNTAAEYIDHGLIFVNPCSGISACDTDGKELFNTIPDIVPFCAEYLWLDTVQVPQQEARILALHELLKAKGYDHIFVNTCNPILETKHIDVTCPNFYYLHYTSFYEFGLDNYPDEIRKLNHFSPVVHAKYAEKLIDYIKTQGLISQP